MTSFYDANRRRNLPTSERNADNETVARFVRNNILFSLHSRNVGTGQGNMLRCAFRLVSELSVAVVVAYEANTRIEPIPIKTDAILMAIFCLGRFRVHSNDKQRFLARWSTVAGAYGRDHRAEGSSLIIISLFIGKWCWARQSILS